MRRLHYISVLILIAGSVLYTSMLIYFHENVNDKTVFVDTISSVVGNDVGSKGAFSDTIDNLSSKELSLEPLGLSLTENRVIVVAMFFALFLFGSVVYLAIKERSKVGRNTIQIPLITLSVILAITFISQSIFLGVF